MDFGELRSRIHSGEDPYWSWNEIDILSKKENYWEEIVPYLSAFPEYWKDEGRLIDNCRLEDIEEDHKIAPYLFFNFNLTEYPPKDFWRNPLLNLLVGFHLDPYIGTGNKIVSNLVTSPFLHNVTHLSLDQNDIDLNGVALLAASPFLRNIRTLYMDRDIGYEGEKVIRRSPHFSRDCDFWLI